MKYSFSYCVQPRWTTLSIQQPFFFVLLLLSSPWVWAQQSNPLPCSDLGRICTAYIQYLLPSSSSVEDVQNLFNVKPDAITAESSSAYTAKAPYKQSLIVKVQCSCSPEKKYFAYTSYDTTANGTTFDSIVNNAYEGFAWSDHYNATQTFPQNTPVPLSILCGCSNVDWNYLLSHVVTQDDTLLLLAQRFNSDVASIQAVNNVKNDLIYTGVVYFIPINSVDGQVGGPSGPSTNNTPPSKGTSFQGPHGGVPMKIIVGSVVGALLIMVVLVVVYVRSKVLANQQKGSLGDKKSLSKVQNNYTNFIFGSFSSCIGDKSNHERTSMDILIRPSSLRKDLMNNVFDVEKPVVFTYEEVYEATDNFKEERLLGQGGYGSVFLGVLRDQEVAIKRMKATSTKEFLAELNILCKVHHTNLVELIGYCTSEDYLFLVYEYAENRALSDHLHDPVAKGFTPLTWNARVQVALDSARGLEYIHDHTKEHYVHRDVKSNNILLDSNFRAKVADFGLAKLVEKNS
ncbi:hypothetical protein O6H91_Y436100 [Diphasiastrum complanatum]|nr:hypothetical protein O6H91_Y436100 [Diphasiastrum complanatum]